MSMKAIDTIDIPNIKPKVPPMPDMKSNREFNRYSVHTSAVVEPK